MIAKFRCSRRVDRRHFALSGLLALLALTAGCNWLAAGVYYLGPPRKQPPEYTFGAVKLAIVIEDRHAQDSHALFDQVLHEKLADEFEQNKVRAEIIPYRKVLELRSGAAGWRTWSMQRIGRELGAEQVLYILIEDLTLREDDTMPVVTPRATLRMKLIGVNDPAAHARLWPEEPEGRLLTVTQSPQEYNGFQSVDSAATRLARETAWLAAQPFYEVDLEAARPRFD